MTRPCTVLIWMQIKDAEGVIRNNKVSKGQGTFHQWGCDYEEFDTGPGNFSSAIVEMSNGEVINVRADMIRFDDVAKKGDCDAKI